MASYDLQIPISEETIRSLHVGDQVRLYGTVVTARDAAHKYMKDTFFKGNAIPEARTKVPGPPRRACSAACISDGSGSTPM